jgi:hypothetical protein
MVGKKMQGLRPMFLQKKKIWWRGGGKKKEEEGRRKEEKKRRKKKKNECTSVEWAVDIINRNRNQTSSLAWNGKMWAWNGRKKRSNKEKRRMLRMSEM